MKGASMEQELCIKIADEISDKLISINKERKVHNKTIIEIYNELLEEKYQPYHYDILSYIPERLAIKGYEITNSNNFELRKY